LAEADAHRQDLSFQVAGADERPVMQDLLNIQIWANWPATRPAAFRCWTTASSSWFAPWRQSN